MINIRWKNEIGSQDTPFRARVSPCREAIDLPDQGGAHEWEFVLSP
jgi:hypothetical protein